MRCGPCTSGGLVTSNLSCITSHKHPTRRYSWEIISRPPVSILQEQKGCHKEGKRVRKGVEAHTNPLCSCHHPTIPSCYSITDASTMLSSQYHFPFPCRNDQEKPPWMGQLNDLIPLCIHALNLASLDKSSYPNHVREIGGRGGERMGSETRRDQGTRPFTGNSEAGAGSWREDKAPSNEQSNS